jgi:hypothetical protein
MGPDSHTLNDSNNCFFSLEPLAHVHADANDVGKGSYYWNIINCLVKAATLTSSLTSQN